MYKKNAWVTIECNYFNLGKIQHLFLKYESSSNSNTKEYLNLHFKDNKIS